MKHVRGVLAELAGLFVEDGWFAFAIALWLAVAGMLTAIGFATSPMRGLLLFIGLATVLVLGIARGATND